MKTDEEYRGELRKLVEDNVISVCAKISKHSLDTKELELWIYRKTFFLESIYNNNRLSLGTRIYYVLNNIDKPLVCKNEKCNNLITKNISFF